MILDNGGREKEVGNVGQINALLLPLSCLYSSPMGGMNGMEEEEEEEEEEEGAKINF